MNPREFPTSVILSRPKGVSKNLCCIPQGTRKKSGMKWAKTSGAFTYKANRQAQLTVSKTPNIRFSLLTAFLVEPRRNENAHNADEIRGEADAEVNLHDAQIESDVL